jgi:hypothetical protein
MQCGMTTRHQFKNLVVVSIQDPKRGQTKTTGGTAQKQVK